MPRTKKRKHEESDAITIIGSPSPQKDFRKSKKDCREKKLKYKTEETSHPTPIIITSPKSGAVSQSFDVFKRALSNLLSVSSVAPNIHTSLGDKKANFVTALQGMKSSGDLAWLDTDSSPSDMDLIEEGEEKEATLPALVNSPDTHTLPKAPALSLSCHSVLPASVPATWPPPLPVIRNEKLRQQAFTHKSFIKGEDVGLPGTEQRHYERLEFLGDSYLQSIASHILFNRFPTQREGALSDMRQQLVANKPLSTYATMYEFHTLIREGKGQENLAFVPGTTKPQYKNRIPVVAKSDLNKTLADCFEAYIAAIILDDPVNGVATATQWLQALYAPKLLEMEMQYRDIAPIDKMAKQTLNTIAGGNKVSIDYKWTDGKGGNKGGFWITVFLTGWGWEGREIGKGWGTNKGDAALRAAMNVIANKNFVDEMAQTKLQWLGPKPSSVLNTPALASTTTSGTSSPRPIAQNGDTLNYDD